MVDFLLSAADITSIGQQPEISEFSGVPNRGYNAVVFGRTFALALAAFLTFFLSSLATAQNTASGLASKMVQTYLQWGPKANSPGAILTLKEISSDGGKFGYRLFANGLPPSHMYTLVQWPVTSLNPVPSLQGVTFNPAGLALCAGQPGTCGDPAKPNDPIDLIVAATTGEPFRFAVLAQDDPKIHAFVKVVPLPNIARDKGCSLEATLLLQHAELIVVEGSNFPPEAALKMTSNSEGEIKTADKKSDAAGHSVFAIMPAKAGLKSGVIKIELSSASCSPGVSVAWSSMAGNSPPTN